MTYVDRQGSNSRKWDGLDEHFDSSDLLPLWIADMDFKAPDFVIDAIKKSADFGVFGYKKTPEEWFEAIIDWEKRNHNYDIKKEWICSSPGVVSGFSWILQCMTEADDSVIIFAPVYYPFAHAIVDNGRKLIESELVRVKDTYEMELADFESKVSENDVKLCIFCSPHNPCGRVWKKDELKQFLDICKKHSVKVISDEIHQDFVFGNNRHIPTATVGDYSDILFTISAPSKTFNLAGLQNSYLIIENEQLRSAYLEHVNKIHLCSCNIFGYEATIAAYKHGQAWLDEVCSVIWKNYCYMKGELLAKFPKIWIADLQGTYLMWVDLGAYVAADEIEDFIQNACKIAPDFGSWFGGCNSSTCIRINLATSYDNIIEATKRISLGLLSRN